MDEGLRDVEALLTVAVVIGRDLEAGLLAAAKERVVELVAGLTSADPHRPVTTTPRIRPVGERLQPSEVRQAMCEVPIDEPVVGPAVEVHRVAAIEDHRVDRRRSTKDAASLFVDRSAAELR